MLVASLTRYDEKSIDKFAKILSETNQEIIYGKIKYPWETNHDHYKSKLRNIARKTRLLLDGKVDVVETELKETANG